MGKIGIVLGSGLNEFANELENPQLIFKDLSGAHQKKIKSGNIDNKQVVIFEGRNHLYEEKNLDKILFNVNKAKELDIQLMIITNAAGGLNSRFQVSDLMLMTSHLNLLNTRIPSGKNQNYYDKDIIEKVKELGKINKIKLHTGVYCATPGPMYETSAEINFFSFTGVDAVGMSTIPEIIYANKLGIKTIAISCITNMLSSVSCEITEHDDVITAGKKAYPSFSKLTKAIISEY